jgi:hypothetical protein
MNDVAFIELANGRGTAIVDAEDFPNVNQFKWYLDDNGYANRPAVTADGRRTKMYLHREVNKTPSGMRTDHIDRNRLNNTRRNLRDASSAQNNANASKRTNSRSKYKGVSKVTSSKRNKCWRARFQLGDMFICQYFYTELEAAHAWNEMAKQYMGEYALLNDVTQTINN